MVKQYPYALKWEDRTEGGVDENGFPLPSTGVEVELKCRYEAFKSGNYKELLNRNNEVVFATGTVYLKRGTNPPPQFSVIEIPEYNLKAEVLHSYKGQLNTTVFIYQLL